MLDLSGVFVRFSLLPIFNVDPHYGGKDTTVECNIGTRGGKGEFWSETKESGITIPSRNGQKFYFSAVNGGMELNRGGPATLGPDCTCSMNLETLILQQTQTIVLLIEVFAVKTANGLIL